MRSGVIILCRYSSNRLPGKILLEINDKSILQYIIERLAPLGQSNVVVATSTESSDDTIATFCTTWNIPVFRGDLNDVAQRFLDCACHFGFDYAVRINGDNLFTDAELICKLVGIAEKEGYEFVSNVQGRTFPIGMSVEVVKVNKYATMISKFNEDKYHEHVTLYFYEHPSSIKAFFVRNEEMPSAAGIHLAIDEQADIHQAETLLNKMDKPHTAYSWKEIINLLQQT